MTSVQHSASDPKTCSNISAIDDPLDLFGKETRKHLTINKNCSIVPIRFLSPIKICDKYQKREHAGSASRNKIKMMKQIKYKHLNWNNCL